MFTPYRFLCQWKLDIFAKRHWYRSQKLPELPFHRLIQAIKIDVALFRIGMFINMNMGKLLQFLFLADCILRRFLQKQLQTHKLLRLPSSNSEIDPKLYQNFISNVCSEIE